MRLGEVSGRGTSVAPSCRAVGLAGALSFAAVCANVSVAAADAPDCQPQYPAGTWHFAVGYAEGAASALAAEQAARDDAGRRLMERITAPFTPAQRDVIRAAIDTSYSKPRVLPNPAGGFDACAFALIPASGLSDDVLRRDADAFDAALRERWAALRAAVGGSKPLRVRLDPTTWGEDQDAGELGQAFRMHLRTTAPAGTVFVDDVRDGRGALSVRTRLSSDGRGLAAEVAYRVDRGWSAAGSLVAFASRSLGLLDAQAPAESFLSDRRLGLPNGGERVGKGGLRVSLDVPQEAEMCESRRYAVQLTANRPAYVVVLSVLDDGRVVRGWETPEPVTAWRSPPEHDAVAVPVEGANGVALSDRMVAIAVPAALGRESLSAAVPPPACVTEPGRGFDAARLPPEAAVATTRVAVVRAGRAYCPPLSTETKRLVTDLQGFLRDDGNRCK